MRRAQAGSSTGLLTAEYCESTISGNSLFAHIAKSDTSIEAPVARITGSERAVELMVNCKTYPAVSTKYTETVCTGGVQPTGEFVRLYPIPFRFLDGSEQYGRWDVIRVRAYRDSKDTRPESWHIEPGAKIEVIEKITTDRRRWEWMQHSVYPSAKSMADQGVTNGLVEIEPLKFTWKPDKKEWTPGQLNIIHQGDLFASKETMRDLSDRVPWQFRLQYREKCSGVESEGKVLAWSYYEGYRREFQKLNSEESALEAVGSRIRASIFNPDRAVFAILGTHSRFGHWMISAIWHVPKDVVAKDVQPGLLF